MKIRKYAPADKDQILELLRLNTPEYFAPEEEQDLINYFKNHAQHYFVLETDGKIAGCGGINYFVDDEASARISWDIVHPDFQGHGVGSQLTHFRIKTIKENPAVERIIVRTTQLAYRFYEKQGFTLKEVVADYWAPGFDLYYMEMDAASNT